MNLELIPGGLWNILGSVVIVAFGVAVALVRPRSKAQKWFVAFAVSFGLGSGLSNINVPDPLWLHDVVWGMVIAGYTLSIPAVLGLAFSYAGRPERASSWWLTLVPAVTMGALVVGGFIVGRDNFRISLEAAGILWTPTVGASVFALFLFLVATFTASIVFALWGLRGDTARVQQAALMSSTVILYSAWLGGSWSAIPTSLMVGAIAAVVLGTVWLSAIWIVNTRRGVSSAAARNAALMPLAAVLAGLVLNVERAPWALGLTRILMTAILAYAIVRHKAFGIDAKVRFGISKGTVAGVILSVVFVASEGAQSFFGNDKQWLGLVAGGLVVFAIAPLQRFAEGLAEKAVPTADGATTSRLKPSEAAYVEALRAASRDGAITRREETHLAFAADHLGIKAARALELREHVEEGAR